MYVVGEEHSTSLPPSSSHSKVASGSDAVKVNVAVVEVVSPDGPDVIVVVGPAAAAPATTTRSDHRHTR